MLRKFVLGAIVLGVCGVGYAAGGQATPARPAGPAVGKPEENAQSSARRQPRAPFAEGTYDTLTVTVELPGAGKAAGPAAGKSSGSPQTEEPSGRGAGRARGSRMGMGPGGGCPREMTGATLGVEIAQPHGCIVGSVSKGGPAGKAGIKVGDSIAACGGQAVTCPATLFPYLQRGGEARKLKLTVYRPKEARLRGSPSSEATPKTKGSEGAKPAAAGKR